MGRGTVLASVNRRQASAGRTRGSHSTAGSHVRDSRAQRVTTLLFFSCGPEQCPPPPFIISEVRFLRLSGKGIIMPASVGGDMGMDEMTRCI